MSQPSSDLPDFGEEMVALPEDGSQSMAPASPAVVYRKKGFTIYTVFLIMSFAFLLISAILLFLNAGNFQ